MPVVVAEGEDEPEVEEEVEPLKPISEDPSVATFGEEEGAVLEAWTSRMYDTEFPAYATAIAKSNRWPGAYAAIAKSGDKSSCIYFGYGLENAGKNFTLEAFPPIAAESAETAEADEITTSAENAIFKEIDEAKTVAANTELEAPEE